MLIVQQLSWPILFGQNHLSQTDAHIYSKALKVHFADLPINVTFKFYASNPLSVFPTIRPRGTLPGSAANANVIFVKFSLYSHQNINCQYESCSYRGGFRHSHHSHIRMSDVQL